MVNRKIIIIIIIIMKVVKKKKLNTKLEHHLARPYALLHEVSAFIYILVDIPRDAQCILINFLRSYL